MSSAPSFVTLQPAVTDVVKSEEVVHLLPAGPPQPAKINHINLINPGENIVQISQQPQPQTYTAEPRPPAKKRILTSTSDGGNVGLLASLDLSSAPGLNTNSIFSCLLFVKNQGKSMTLIGETLFS